MGSVSETEVFNNPEVFVEGWYWVARSSDLKKNSAMALDVLGKNLVAYRGKSGSVYAMDAYCPHMGAHLAEGKVEGDSIRCLFHYWRFDEQGRCTDIPCQKSVKGIPPVKTYPLKEQYGLIWLWAGDGKRPVGPLPTVPELENTEVNFMVGNQFEKKCHPTVVMVNAIDAQHFDSVHNVPTKLNLIPKDGVCKANIVFSNATRVPDTNILYRTIGRFYAGPLTYLLSYWYGSSGVVTVGPDLVHFHIVFAIRPTKDGSSKGCTLLVTKKRKGVLGYLANRALLVLSYLVAKYFAKGDTLIFESINFKLKTPIKADSAIISFVQHTEKQRALRWSTWDEARARPKEAPEVASIHRDNFALT